MKPWKLHVHLIERGREGEKGRGREGERERQRERERERANKCGSQQKREGKRVLEN